MSKQVSAPEVRAAKSFLERRNLKLNPKQFATAAKELDIPFKEVLKKLVAKENPGG